MNYIEKTKELKAKIDITIRPYIKSDFIFLGLPYYDNIGDVLIWEGTEQFLKGISFKCLQRASIETFDFPDLQNDITILLQGGGNFGDVWFEHQDFRLKVIQKYSKNPIIILPQSVFYNDESVCVSECEILKQHPKLTVFARDKYSYELLHSKSLDVKLAPDMAFYISLEELNTKNVLNGNTNLMLMRGDKELANYDYSSYVFSVDEIEKHDWPSYESKLWFLQIMYKLKCKPIRTIGLADWWGLNFFKKKMISTGVRFLNRYNTIYTTRLHGAILSVLLGKDVVLFDNSYGKNSGYYDTWLYDLDSIKMIRK